MKHILPPTTAALPAIARRAVSALSVTAATAGLLALASPALAQIPERYEITEVIVGTCNNDFTSTTGHGINANDAVTGYHKPCGIVDVPFVWTPEDGFFNIPMPADFDNGRAFGIDGPLVVGYAEISNDDGLGRQAFIYNIDSGGLEFVPQPEGGDYTELLAVSNGRAVGNWGNIVQGKPAVEAFIWEDGVFTSLAPDLGSSVSRGDGINNVGMVTGWMGENAPSFDGNAYIWHEGEVTKLPVIPDGFTSKGLAINAHGDVAGSGILFDKDVGDEVSHAFGYIDGVMHRIQPFPGWEDAFARAIGETGMVGGSSESPGAEAFIWYQGETVRLTDLIDPGAGIELDIVKEIRPDGTILCDGLQDVQGAADKNVTVILTPVFPPLGDLDDDGVVGSSDLIILLGAWGRCRGECPADLDENGVVGTGDLILLLGNWG